MGKILTALLFLSAVGCMTAQAETAVVKIACSAPASHTGGTKLSATESVKYTVYEINASSRQKLVEFMGACGGSYTTTTGRHMIVMTATDSGGRESADSAPVDFTAYKKSAERSMCLWRT